MKNETLIMWPEANVPLYNRAVQIAGIRSGINDIEERISILRKEITELERLNDESGELETILRRALEDSRRDSERLMRIYYLGVWYSDGGAPTFEEWCNNIDKLQIDDLQK